MKSNNHYEIAFREFLQRKKIPYVQVDESHRCAFANSGLKSFDFIIYPSNKHNLLVDIKGRKAKPGKKSDWLFDPWITHEDISALDIWQKIFGNTFCACFIFAFWLGDNSSVSLFEPFEFHNRYYRFFMIYLDDYRQYIRTRSERWNTITIPRAVFTELAIDINQLLV